MKQILWVSKNAPIPSQIAELKKLFGDDMTLVIDRNPFSDASDIIKRYKSGEYDEMVLIAPLSVCRVITDWGFKPLWSEMRAPRIGEAADVEVFSTRENPQGKKRSYKFIRFRRLESIEMKFSDLPLDK